MRVYDVTHRKNDLLEVTDFLLCHRRLSLCQLHATLRVGSNKLSDTSCDIVVSMKLRFDPDFVCYNFSA